MLTGIDVSHHQGAINWSAVAAAGHAFAWCKATEGTGFTDSRFRANWSGIRTARLARGAYHFLRSDSDPAAQARHFLAVVGDLTGSLAAVDVESSLSSRPTASQARAFKNEFARRTGGHPLVLYTGRWYWRGVLGDPYGADLGPLWHSAYTTSPGPLYGGWRRFTFWQYTQTGRCPGVPGSVDIDNFFGDRQALAALQREDWFAMATRADLRAAIAEEFNTVGSTTRRAVHDLVRRCVAEEWSSAGTRTRSGYIDLVGRQIASPTGRLHQALDAWRDSTATATDPAPATEALADLTPEEIAAAIPQELVEGVAEALATRLA